MCGFLAFLSFFHKVYLIVSIPDLLHLILFATKAAGLDLQRYQKRGKFGVRKTRVVLKITSTIII